MEIRTCNLLWDFLFSSFWGDRRTFALLLVDSLMRGSYVAGIFCIFVTHLWLYTIIVPTCAWAGYHNTKMYHGTYVSLNIMMPLSKHYRVNLCLAFGKGICDPNLSGHERLVDSLIIIYKSSPIQLHVVHRIIILIKYLIS